MIVKSGAAAGAASRPKNVVLSEPLSGSVTWTDSVGFVAIPVALLAGWTSTGAAGGSFGGGGGVKGEPATHRGPPTAVPAGPPATELATLLPAPSFMP